MDISISVFKNYLKNNVVEFYYLNKYGTPRFALGTTNLSYVNSINPNIGTNIRQPPDYVIRYYDINKQCWCSLLQNNLFHFECNLIGLHH